MMKIYDDNDMDAPGMELAKAGLDAFVEDLKTPELSKVQPLVLCFAFIDFFILLSLSLFTS